MKKYSPVKELIASRLREFIREPEALFWVYVFPIVLMIGLGLAFDSGGGKDELYVRLTPAADSSDSTAVAKVRETLSAVEGIILEDPPRENGAPVDLEVIVGENGVEYVTDPTAPKSRLAYLEVDAALQKAAGRADSVTATLRSLDQPGRRYVDWLIPGLMGLNIMGGGVWGVGFVTVEIRMRKLLKRFVATPMRRSQFLLAMMVSRLVFLLSEMVVIFFVGYLLFGLRVQGNPLLLCAVVLAGAVTFTGLGLLIGCRAKKIETISGLTNLFMLPMWLVSGVFFSAERYPDFLQPIIQALPLTQLNNALRAVILDGSALTALWLPLAVLGAWAILAFPLALKWFRWQ